MHWQLLNIKAVQYMPQLAICLATAPEREIYFLLSLLKNKKKKISTDLFGLKKKILKIIC